MMMMMMMMIRHCCTNKRNVYRKVVLQGWYMLKFLVPETGIRSLHKSDTC